MPQIIRGIDQIMAERQRDTLFLQFPGLGFWADPDEGRASAEARRIQFAWLEARGLTWEMAAPRGWLEGDTGLYAVHCDIDDPRIAAYSAEYENAEGTSLDPGSYQLNILDFGSWRTHHEARLTSADDGDDDVA